MNTNKQTLIGVASFTIGAALGALFAWKLTARKYELIVQEELDSLKETFKKKVDKVSSSKLEVEEDDEEYVATEEKKIEYQTVVNNYTCPSHTSSYLNKPSLKELAEKGNLKPMNCKEVKEPYVITPEQAGDGDYAMITLTMYADGIVADDQDRIIDDDELETLVGSDIEGHFGEYEEDTVFVRNDKICLDYEVLRDLGTYQAVTREQRPHEVDD